MHSGQTIAQAKKAGNFVMSKELGNRDRLQHNSDEQQSPNPTGRQKPNGQPSPQQRPSNSLNKWLFLLVGVMLIIWLYNYFNTSFNNSNSTQVEMTYSDYYKQVEENNVKTAVFTGSDSITGDFNKAVRGKTQYHVNQLPYADNNLPQRLTTKHVKVTSQPAQDNSLWITLITVILPWALLLGLIFFLSPRSSHVQQ